MFGILCRHGADANCTTRFENTHRTVRREVLYAHHPWFAHEVWVHAVIEKADGVFFRCTLDGAETDRFLEIPAWMFERACCAHGHVTRDPFVSLDALMALSSLLDLVLNTATPSSNARLLGACRASRDQNRGEAHVRQDGGVRSSESTQPVARRATEQQRSCWAAAQCTAASMLRHGGNCRERRAGNLMTQLMLEHAQRQASVTVTVTVEASHDH